MSMLEAITSSFRFIRVFLLVAFMLFLIIIGAKLTILFIGDSNIEYAKKVLAGLALILAMVYVHAIATILASFIHIKNRTTGV